METASRAPDIRFGYYLLQLETELPPRAAGSAEASRLRGIVEDLRTGERLPFDGLKELGSVLGWDTGSDDARLVGSRATGSGNKNGEAR